MTHICDLFFQELKLKDEECEKLLKVRDQIGEELEELTASLFEVHFNHLHSAILCPSVEKKCFKHTIRLVFGDLHVGPGPGNR
jgi:hypothetical protein